jgi:hypothetical protein
MCRILHAHYGYVPDEYKELLCGGHQTSGPQGPSTMSADGRLFASEKLGQILSDITQEKYGPKSFLRYYVKGVVCTSDCTVCHPFLLVFSFTNRLV